MRFKADSRGTHIAALLERPVLMEFKMRRLSKVQFNRAIEGKPVITPEAETATFAQNKSKRASRMIVSALVVVVGIGAGWIGGKVLSRRMSNSPAAAPASHASAGDPSTALPSPQSQAPSKRTSAVVASPSEPTPESKQPEVASEHRAKESEPNDAPPKTPKVDKNDGPETPTAEDPAKEIGRQAVKKMSKEVKKMKRGLASKNENEDRH
jgi:hypothetical protein